MSDNSKKTIERSPSGEYTFTPYGEFLSYFHAHLEIFKRFYKSKSFPDSKLNKDLPQLKSFMASHVKNVDQYFPNIPKFAELMSVNSRELSDYLNQHFLEILPMVQERFKKAEIDKLSSSPMREFDRVTEEIVEHTGFVFPSGKRFTLKGNLVVLEDLTTGEILEPQGIMAGIAPTPAVIGADAKAQIPVVTKIIPDNPILAEIIELMGSDLSGIRLDVQSEIEDISVEREEIHTPQDDILEDIEDLDFEMPYESGSSHPGGNESTDDSYPSNVLDDIGDLLGGLDESDSGYLATPQESISSEVENFGIQEYFELVKNILSYQSKKDESGYRSYVSQSPAHTKAAIEIRKLHIQDMKSGGVDWNRSLDVLCDELGMNSISVQTLKEKVILANWVRTGLDKGLTEFKKGSPEFLELIKKAWPHIQVAFYESPDYDRVLERLKVLVGKVGNQAHRKEMVRVLSLVIQYLKSKK